MRALDETKINAGTRPRVAMQTIEGAGGAGEVLALTVGSVAIYSWGRAASFMIRYAKHAEKGWA
jgi:hypothetical protein